MTDRDPLTRQRSRWRQLRPITMGAITGMSYRRDVGDGFLALIVADEPAGWHLSISHRRPTKHGVEYVRYPRWDEIAGARDEFLPADRAYVMVLPRPEDYVAAHKTTFHLHELTAGLLAMAEAGTLG